MLAHYQNLAEDLFNAVFVSIWSDQLTEDQQVIISLPKLEEFLIEFYFVPCMLRANMLRLLSKSNVKAFTSGQARRKLKESSGKSKYP